jgi:D-lyxose ketol-isomerase
MARMSRRRAIGGMLAGGVGAVGIGCGSAQAAAAAGEARKPLRKFRNEEFYKDGKFDPVAAKAAYYEMFESFGYPIYDRLRTEDFWTLEFGLGNFLEAGMAGIFWVNNKEHNYFGHEIYLLPGQAIPEHAHVKTEVDAKMEGWMPRHGFIYIYGEGTPTPGVDARIPPLHRECAVARTERILRPGQVAGLAKAGEKHWMRAGPEGAIVTEYATYHDGKGLRFSHPKAVL